MNYRNTFFALVFVLLIATIWWVWADKYVNGQQISNHKEELAKLEKQFQDLIEVQESYDKVKVRHQSKLAEFDSLKTRIVYGQDAYIRHLESIRNLAQKQNIQISTLSPSMDDSFPAIKSKLRFTKKHIERYTVQIRLLGNFLTIGAFLEELLNMPVMINIGRITMETELTSAGNLACEVILYTYVFLDQI